MYWQVRMENIATGLFPVMSKNTLPMNMVALIIHRSQWLICHLWIYPYDDFLGTRSNRLLLSIFLVWHVYTNINSQNHPAGLASEYTRVGKAVPYNAFAKRKRSIPPPDKTNEINEDRNMQKKGEKPQELLGNNYGINILSRNQKNASFCWLFYLWSFCLPSPVSYYL